MHVPRALTQSLLAPAVIAMVLASTVKAGAADQTAAIHTAHNQKTERLIFTPANLGFGPVSAGEQKVQMVTMTNVGDSEVTLLQAIGQGMDFTLSGLDLPLTLARGESFTFTVVFAPRAPGQSSGSVLFISAGSGVSSRILMTGSGTEGKQLAANAAAMNFGIVSVGSAGNQRGMLSAAGKKVTIASAVSSDPQFTITGLSFPFTIRAGGRREFVVTFTPRSSGAVSVTLSFMDVSGTKALLTESLNGIGTIVHGHSVDLRWRASSAKDVIGYNVYRGMKSGGPYRKINFVLDAATVYTDTSVVDGSTYYYVTTAVDSKDRESIYSKQAWARIP